MKTLTYPEYKRLLAKHQRIALYREILADRITPVSMIESLHEEMKQGAILESGLNHPQAGRFSFIAIHPVAQFKVYQHQVEQTLNGKKEQMRAEPLPALRELIQKLACGSLDEQSGFSSGAVGFFAYDAVRLFEKIPDRHPNLSELPEIFFNFYQTTFMYDHYKQTLLINHIIDVGADPEVAYHQGIAHIERYIHKISQSTFSNSSASKSSPLNDTPIETDIADDTFIKMVERAKQYIIAGDAFQIVLSRCFKKAYNVSPIEIYRALRQVSPSPYMFYLPIGDRVIVGASPEKMVGVQQGKVSVNPIAGTRRRSKEMDTHQIENELLNDPKEKAEHMMLVDLARNDLGAVSIPGTVKVEELMQPKHYSHVSHLVSVVTGQLAPGLDALDALAKAFPAGTLSGAPKIRAMEIIDELEASRRGMYGGAICRLDFQGNLDSCIAIRMAVLKDGVATIRTGAGIVFDSNPQAEADETRHKAQSVLAAIKLAQEGLS